MINLFSVQPGFSMLRKVLFGTTFGRYLAEQCVYSAGGSCVLRSICFMRRICIITLSGEGIYRIYCIFADAANVSTGIGTYTIVLDF